MNAPLGDVVTVVICDDDPLTLSALRLLLKDRQINVIAACATHDDCIQAMRDHPPAVAVVDLQFEGDRKAGLQLIRHIRDVSPTTRCLVLTATDSPRALLREAFLAGAHGFQRKGYVSGNALPGVVKHLALGEWEFDAELASTLYKQAAASTRSHSQRESVQLMPAERTVLELLATGHNLSGIADKLQIPKAAVHGHLRNITDKFHKAGS